MKARLLAALIAGVSSVGTFAVSAGATTTAYAQMKAVIADANANKSVRLTTTAKMSGLKIVEITDAGRTEGRQSITLTKLGYSDTVIVEYIAGKLFAKGDASILTTYLGLSQTYANELAGHWFGIPKASGYYAQVGEGLTVSSAMAEVTITSSVSSAPAAHRNGAVVDVLKGSSVKTSLQPSFKETLYFSTAKQPLPVEVTQSVQGSLGAIAFSHWNESFSLKAPKVTQYLN